MSLRINKQQKPVREAPPAPRNRKPIINRQSIKDVAPASNSIKHVDYNGQKITCQYMIYLHSLGEPAFKSDTGEERWYKNGILHREGGPAFTHPDGSLLWYCDGELHNEDAPAIIHHNGKKEWYKNGLRHRENGPAVENGNNVEYWLNDEKVELQDLNLGE